MTELKKRGRKLKYYGEKDALCAIERNRKAALERVKHIAEENAKITIPLAEKLKDVFKNSKVKSVQTGLTLQLSMLDLDILKKAFEL